MITVCLIACDVAVAIASLAGAVWLREHWLTVLPGVGPFEPAVDYGVLWPALGLMVLLRGAVRLYPGYGMTAPEELRVQTHSSLLLGAFLLIGGALFRYGASFSRIVLVLAIAGIVTMLPVARATAKWVLRRLPRYGSPAVVIGRGEKYAEIAALFEQDQSLGLRAAREGEAASVCVLVPGELRTVRMADLIDELTQRYHRVLLIPELLDISSVWVAPRDVRGHLALELRDNLARRRYRAAKRTLDLVISVGLSPVVFVVCLFIGALVRLDSVGGAVIRQVRVGRGGRRFTLLKFRTMRVDADRRLEALLAADPGARREWQEFRKLRRDPRVTRVGRVLRAWSLDELPQVWNVLMGEMSLVGPRPVMPDEVELYGRDSSLYTRLRPGLTGLFQVSGRSQLTYQERVRLDSYYSRNWSIWLDIVILARTSLAVVRRTGAY